MTGLMASLKPHQNQRPSLANQEEMWRAGADEIGNSFPWRPCCCSRFEAVLAMPLQKMMVRLISSPERSQNATGLVDHGLYAGCIIDMPRNQDLVIVSDADQAAIKHP